MNRLIERCAMLDIHKSQITACVRVPDDVGGRRQEIREFATTFGACSPWPTGCAAGR